MSVWLIIIGSSDLVINLYFENWMEDKKWIEYFGIINWGIWVEGNESKVNYFTEGSMYEVCESSQTVKMIITNQMLNHNHDESIAEINQKEVYKYVGPLYAGIVYFQSFIKIDLSYR